jgi:hypothetical protein
MTQTVQHHWAVAIHTLFYCAILFERDVDIVPLLHKNVFTNADVIWLLQQIAAVKLGATSCQHRRLPLNIYLAGLFLSIHVLITFLSQTLSHKCQHPI